VTLILWLSFLPGRWYSIEMPMPNIDVCKQAISELKLNPRPREWVVKCEVTQ